jgi:trigger factor
MNAVDVSVETPGGLERKMTVRVPTIEIEREVSVRLNRVGQTAKIKGFRPGKIPTKIVQQRYGDQVRQEVLSDLIRSNYSRALVQEELRPAGSPSIESLPVDSEEQFAFRATFEVYPEVTLAAIDKLSVERPSVEIGESDVDDLLEKLREQRADWQTIERVAGSGDRVIIDFVGKIDNEIFEGGEGREVPIVVGEGQVIDDFDKALKGVAAGESKSAKVKFPKDYPADALAGKKAVFDLTIHRVEECILPEVDDEFISAFGVAEGGVEALREHLQENMTRELSQRLRAETKRRALDSLLTANPIALPGALIDRETAVMQADALRQLGIDDPEQAPPKESFDEAARRRVALGLLVQELIQVSEIQLDRPRLEARLKEMVAQYERPEEAAQMYRGNKELMAQLEAGVLEEQIVDYLLEKSKTTEKSMSFEQFMAL